LLPDHNGLRKRQASGKGLTRPELALLLSYAKHSLYKALLDSDLPEDPCMAPELERYFPSPLRQLFRSRIHEHRLRREILASTLANRLINRFGSTFVFRLQEELGVSGASVARVYAVVWEVFSLRRVWSGVARLGTEVAQAMHIDILGRAGRLAARACRWLLQHYDEQIRVVVLIERYQSKVDALAAHLPELLDDLSRRAFQQIAQTLEQAGVPPDLAARVAGFDAMARAFDLVYVAETCNVPVEEAALIYFGLGADLDLQWLGQRFAALPSQDRWRAGARSSLRDELFAQHRALCIAVLRSAMDGTSAESKREAWRRQHHMALERFQRLIADLKSQSDIDMAMLTVALTALRRLVEEALPGSGDVDEKSGTLLKLK
jgi:glutamate dehydrogenase